MLPERMKDKQPLKDKKTISQPQNATSPDKQVGMSGVKKPSRPVSFESLTKPTAEFTRTLAAEIVKNLVSIGRFSKAADKEVVITNATESLGHRPVFIDTSVLIDGRILPVVNSGFYCGTLLVPKFVLTELQHIADSSDPVRRTKGRRGLEVVEKLQKQKVNTDVKLIIVSDDPQSTIEVDHKLVELAKHHDAALMTVDFNLAKLARVQHVRVFNLGDLSQALKVLAVPGEEFVVKITHEGKERQQGVGYLTDGTMVVVDDAKTLVNSDVPVIITKIHQTPAGQLLFARIHA
jgi:uncharacterized protein YacL